MAATLITYLGLTALLLSLCLLCAIAVVTLRAVLQRGDRTLYKATPEDVTTLMFDGDDLLDATAGGRALFSAMPQDGRSDWQRLISWAQSTFSDQATQLTQLRDIGVLHLGPAGPLGLTLRAEWRSGLCHITLAHQPQAAGTALATASASPADLTRHQQGVELARLQALIAALPLPLWSQTESQTVTSANPAYLRLLRSDPQAEAPPLPWPVPTLFDNLDELPARRVIRDGRGQEQAFRLHPLGTADGITTTLALPLDEAEKAEAALSSFVRTLALTFAELPIGLAVFDKDRCLRLFNPALTDLTTLPVDFLAARPQLFAMLDELRQRRRLPEPRDYTAWRNRINAIGNPGAPPFEELWTLPDGETFQVVGHGHAEGAMTLLFQDISHEVSRSRRLRSDLALGQAVIDGLDLPLAVFSPGGELLLSNEACSAVWQLDFSTRLASTHFLDLSKDWQRRCAPTPLWKDAADWIRQSGSRPDLTGELRLADGRSLILRMKVLPDDASLVTFSPPPQRLAKQLPEEMPNPLATSAPKPAPPPLPHTISGLADGRATSPTARASMRRHQTPDG